MRASTVEQFRIKWVSPWTITSVQGMQKRKAGRELKWLKCLAETGRWNPGRRVKRTPAVTLLDNPIDGGLVGGVAARRDGHFSRPVEPTACGGFLRTPRAGREGRPQVPTGRLKSSVIERELTD